MPSTSEHSVDAPTRGRPDRADATTPWWLVVVVLTLVGAVLPVALACCFGALDLPRGDGAAFLRAAYLFAEHGEVTAFDHGPMNMVGLLVGAAPLIWLVGESVATLHVAVAIVGVVGLCAVYDLGTRLTSSRRALFVASTVAVWPIWLGTTATFYTDVPTFTLVMVSLALGGRALAPTGLRRGLFAASLLSGFLAFSIREHAVVAPLAVVLTALWVARSRDERRSLVGCGVLLLVACGALFVWRQHLSGFGTMTMGLPTQGTFDRTVRALAEGVITSGLLLSPVVVLAGPAGIVRAAWSRARRTTATATGVAFTGMVIYVAFSARAFITLDFEVSSQWIVATHQPPLVAGVTRPLLLVVGIASALVLLCGMIPPVADAFAALRKGGFGRPTSTQQAMLALAVIAQTALFIALTAFGAIFWVRHLLPMLALVALLVVSSRAAARGARRDVSASAVVCVTLLGVLSVVATAANISFEATAWNVAAAAADRVGGADRVDGGFGWNASHRDRDVDPRTRAARRCVAVAVVRTRPLAARRSARVWTVGPAVWIVEAPVRPCTPEGPTTAARADD